MKTKVLFYAACITVWCFSWFVDVKELGFTADSHLLTRFTYMFTHVRFMHLFLNLLTIDLLLSTAFTQGYSKLLPAAIIGAVLATFGSEMSMPTIGASGVLYFLIGEVSARKWSLNVLFLIAVLITVNVMYYLKTNTNTIIHALCFVYGFVYRGLTIIINDLKLKQLA
jgi:membrane associated rhomboid family serine protease